MPKSMKLTDDEIYGMTGMLPHEMPDKAVRDLRLAFQIETETYKRQFAVNKVRRIWRSKNVEELARSMPFRLDTEEVLVARAKNKVKKSCRAFDAYKWDKNQQKCVSVRK